MPDHEKMWREVAEVIYEIGSERDAEFVENVEQRAKDGTLSDAQARWLEDLHARACRSRY
jgi:hypothetical protein